MRFGFENKMDPSQEPTLIEYTKTEKSGQKRSAKRCDSDRETPGKVARKTNQISPAKKERQTVNGAINTKNSASSELNDSITIPASQSPKKKIELPTSSKNKQQKTAKEKFIYGNYSQYYGYRNKDFHDVRLDVFEANREIFEEKDILDIGCNNGFITSAVAKRFNAKSIVGIDIDRGLINQAIKQLTKSKKALPMENEARKQKKYPYNVQYVYGNYVLKDDVLLEIERAQFDVILCLSITKWIQLNFGDSGLKQAFHRIFLQLRPGGCLILEAQPFKNYRKRKYVSEAARENFEKIEFFPDQFTEYLLSEEVGFKEVKLLGVPEHCVEGFKRPIQIFTK